MHIPSLVKIQLSSRNEKLDGELQEDGQTDWHMDDQCETIVYRYYRVAVCKISKLSKGGVVPAVARQYMHYKQVKKSC